MRKLTLVALAASAALIPGTAFAQHHGGGAQPMPPGAGARHGGMHHPGMPNPGMHRPGMHGPGMGMGGPHRFSHIRRIGRGGFVPGFWFGPQFQVRNWGMYGFPAPFAGGRWVRYYDDALLIDRDGRVHDGRYGFDWDRYGDRWGYDDRGVPIYVGDGDYEPDEDDYEWADEGDRGGYREEHVRRGYGGGYGGGAAYGYGAYGGCGCGPVVVTETVTTTAPVVETRTWYEDVVEYVDQPRRAAPRRYVKRPVRRAPPPPPRARPGERG
jgi:Ni/Co efflux regulator RcnB